MLPQLKLCHPKLCSSDPPSVFSTIHCTVHSCCYAGSRLIITSLQTSIVLRGYPPKSQSLSFLRAGQQNTPLYRAALCLFYAIIRTHPRRAPHPFAPRTPSNDDHFILAPAQAKAVWRRPHHRRRPARAPPPRPGGQRRRAAARRGRATAKGRCAAPQDGAPTRPSQWGGGAATAFFQPSPSTNCIFYITTPGFSKNDNLIL